MLIATFFEHGRTLYQPMFPWNMNIPKIGEKARGKINIHSKVLILKPYSCNDLGTRISRPSILFLWLRGHFDILKVIRGRDIIKIIGD